ncbi:hypothetical protein Hanom_Chr14g01266751 [Helianthus anomalus]
MFSWCCCMSFESSEMFITSCSSSSSHPEVLYLVPSCSRSITTTDSLTKLPSFSCFLVDFKL